MKFLYSATVLLALSQLISRLLGVVRDHVIANAFGATAGSGLWNLDTYYAAFRIPDFIYNLLIFGVLSAAFIPLLAEKKSNEEVNRFASNTLNILLIIVIVVAGVMFLVARPLTAVLAPGFSPTEITLAATLLRIQLLAPVLFTISAVFGGLAQHYHRFLGLALAPIFYNLGIIIGAVFLAPRLGVVGLSLGVVGGAAAHALIQLPTAFRAGFRWRPNFIWREFKTFLHLALPRVGALAAGQTQLLAITLFATLVGTGALSVFNYSVNLASLPLGIVGLAVATVSFAGLSRVAKSAHAFSALLRKNILNVLFWVVPAAVGLFILRNDITGLILLGGKFTEFDAYFVAESLAILALAVPAWSLIPVLNNGFFARKNTETPLLIGVLALAVTIGTTWATIDTMQAAGLATGLAVATIITATALFWKLVGEVEIELGNIPLKIVISATVMSLPIFAIASFWQAQNFFELLAKLVIAGALGAGVYFASGKLAGLTEFLPLGKTPLEKVLLAAKQEIEG